MSDTAWATQRWKLNEASLRAVEGWAELAHHGDGKTMQLALRGQLNVSFDVDGKAVVTWVENW